MNVKRKSLRACGLLTVWILFTSVLHGQQLDNIKNQQPLTVNGFISTNQVLTTMPVDSGNKTSYSGYYTGSLNFTIYGVSVPFTFIYSSNKGDYSHPFNQYGLHPSYKWIQTHIGYASMSFTPYTLSGHLFCGGGVELDPPGIFRAKAMVGRLRRSVPYDTALMQQIPAYGRVGFGVQAGVSKEQDFVDLTLFRAYDQTSSLDSIPEALQIYPMDNSVVSVSVGKKIFGNVVFTAEYANSFLTLDKRTGTCEVDNRLLKPATWFMHTRTSTISRNALKANVNYTHQRFTIGGGYERIDPDYLTLGSYYFTNNMENITLNFSVNFLENKITLSGNTGLQRDNLDHSKLNNNTRWVGSGNINFVPNEKLNMNLSYSNFTSYTNVRSTFDYVNQTNPYENWDTLNYRQISQNLNLNTGYQLSEDKDRRQSVNLNLTYQVSDDKQGDTSISKSAFYNANASYILSLVPRDMSISTTLGYNHNEVTAANSSTWGPGVTVSKMYLEKTVRLSLSGSYNSTFTQGAPSGNIYNMRFTGGYVLMKKHNFSLSLLYQLRQRKGENIEAKTYHTSTITFGYVYNFDIIKNKAAEKKDIN